MYPELALTLERHLTLLKQTGFDAACFNLQTNRALIVGRKP